LDERRVKLHEGEYEDLMRMIENKHRKKLITLEKSYNDLIVK